MRTPKFHRGQKIYYSNGNLLYPTREGTILGYDTKAFTSTQIWYIIEPTEHEGHDGTSKMIVRNELCLRARFEPYWEPVGVRISRGGDITCLVHECSDFDCKVRRADASNTTYEHRGF